MLAWLQLLRIAAVFTAIADTWMGLVVATGTLLPIERSLIVTLSTICLYLAGMVLNDWFDVEVDRHERPQRPLPSGRISLSVAAAVGWGLLASGILLAGTVSWMTGTIWPWAFGMALATSIVAYNGYLKQTIAGPLAMGACRGLNVLMALSVAGELETLPWLVPLGMTVYITGVTLFARDEAGQPSRTTLTAAFIVAMTGIGLLALGRIQLTPLANFYPTDFGWGLLWLVVALFAGRRFVAAIAQPQPLRVIGAVKHALLSLILIDASLALAVGGPYYACAILALLAPATLIGYWIRMT